MTSTFRPALPLMAGRTLAFAATFFIPVVLVRIFSQAEFGTYKQFFLIFSTLYGIAQLGMAESLFYFLPMAPQEGGKYVTNSILVLIAVGLACLGLLGSSASKISLLLANSGIDEYMTLIGIYLLLMISSALLEIVMISRKRYGLAASSYGISDLLRAFFLLVPAFMTRQLEWLLLGAVAFASFRFCVTLFYLRYEFGDLLRPDRILLKKQLAYALPFEMAVVVEILQSNFHQYAVSYHFDAATFAIYAVGCLQIPLVDFVAGPVGNVMMVGMTEENREGRNESALAIWHDTVRKLALIFFPLVGLLLVSARELIVFLFTENYLASVPIFMVWSTAILFSVLQTDGVLRVYAETRFLLFLHAIRLVLVVALINWFVSVFHLLGAVLVTVSAGVMGKGLALVRIKTLMKASLAHLLPWRGLGAISAAASAAALLALMVKSQLEISTLPLLLVTCLVYTASYLTLVLGLGLLSEAERLAITTWVQKWSPSRAKIGELIKNQR